MTPPPDDAAAAELARLREQLDTVTEERNFFRQAYLGELAKSDPGFTEEDMASAIPSGPWLEEFLNRMVAGDPNAADSIPSAKKG